LEKINCTSNSKINIKFNGNINDNVKNQIQNSVPMSISKFNNNIKIQYQPKQISILK